MKRLLKLQGAILLVAAILLSMYWFSWKLALIVFLFIWGNNVERNKLDQMIRERDKYIGNLFSKK